MTAASVLMNMQVIVNSLFFFLMEQNSFMIKSLVTFYIKDSNIILDVGN